MPPTGPRTPSNLLGRSDPPRVDKINAAIGYGFRVTLDVSGRAGKRFHFHLRPRLATIGSWYDWLGGD